jgi:hypothetical protein
VIEHAIRPRDENDHSGYVAVAHDLGEETGERAGALHVEGWWRRCPRRQSGYESQDKGWNQRSDHKSLLVFGFRHYHLKPFLLPINMHLH